MRRACVPTVQPTDDVQPVLEGLQRLNRLWQRRLGERTAGGHPCRNARGRIKALILQKENDSLRSTTRLARGGQ